MATQRDGTTNALRAADSWDDAEWNPVVLSHTQQDARALKRRDHKGANNQLFITDKDG